MAMSPPPGPPSCLAMRRPTKIQMPKKMAMGTAQDRSSETKFESNCPRYSTPCWSSSFAMSASTRTATNRFFPPIASLNSPESWSCPTTTFAILSSRTSFWNSL